MISIEESKNLKKFIEIQSSIAINRPMYIITEGDKVTWKNPSDVFDVKALSIGSTIESNNIAYKAVSQKKNTDGKNPRICLRFKVTS